MKTPAGLAEAAFLSSIVASSDDAIISRDLQGEVTTWNRAAERIFGYTAAEIIGQPLAALAPSPADEEPRLMEAILRGERLDHYHTQRRRKDGGLIELSVTVSPIRDADGAIIGASHVARDVTSLREAFLREALLSAIVESSDDAIISKTLDGVVTSWNAGAERIFGYTAEEMIGQPILRIIPPDRHPEETLILSALGRGERVDHFETLRRRKDGLLIHVSATISPIRDATGRVVGASKVARDVTQQHFMREEVRRFAADQALQNQQKNELMAVLAHELRNPLTPLRLGVELLKHRAASPEAVLKVRETLNRQINNLTRLVEDLLDASRLTNGKMTPRMERLDLARLVRYNCETYGVEAGACGLRLECKLPETPLWVCADPTRLDQVVGNLLENAVKFTERGGAITVQAWSEGQTVLLSVEDTGVGVSPELLPRLFSRFTQGEQSLARSRGGLGLGLAIVKGLVELHGGSIEARSGGTGQGTEFRLRFPLLEEPEALSNAAPSAAPVGDSQRVLVVEDNHDAADSLAEVLRVFGYQVQVAYDGEEGLTAAELFHPQVVLCDIGLPKVDGYEVARRMRSRLGASCPRLVAITGYGSDQDCVRAREAGFNTHLTKPVHPDILLHELEPRSDPERGSGRS